jgi:citrate lyase subunit beta/citryl-CoA lyase
MSTGRTEDDIKAVVQPCLDGVVLPKVDDAESVRNADAWLLESEKSQGVDPGSTSLLVLIETGLGVENATQILAASPRVETAIFGFVDFMLDVGIDVLDHTPSADELLYARSRLVVAARAAGVSPPLDGPFIDIRANDAFEAQCRQARRLGFRGKMLIHPGQVAPCHRGFAPTGEEVEAARRIVEQFSQAEGQGVAAIVVDGRLVDYPIYLRAQRIVAGAAQLPLPG